MKLRKNCRFAFHSVRVVCCLLVLSSALNSANAKQETLDLSGKWQVRLAQATESQHVTLPGTLRDNGIGNPPGPNTKWIGTVRKLAWKLPQFANFLTEKNYRMPFWLQPERRYLGKAIYSREIEIPPDWNGRAVELFLERPHWATEIFVDGHFVGRENSLGTPHRFDLTKLLGAGRHKIEIAVNNAIDELDVGQNAHSISDHTQSAWHGIVGKMELRSRPAIAIERVEIFPAHDSKSAEVRVTAVNKTGKLTTAEIELRLWQNEKEIGLIRNRIPLENGSSKITSVVELKTEAARWDEFNPNLCHLEASLLVDGSEMSKLDETFGFRTVRASGKQILVNDRRVFLRGTLECCVFPLTGYPPTNIDTWKDIIAICKSHGFNHIRFHSWCPPKAAFEAADALGFYFQVECSTWPNETTFLGDDLPVDPWVYHEGQRIIDEYGNHPSFLLMAAGNEASGKRRSGFLTKWVQHFDELEDRLLVTGCSGWPVVEQNEFHIVPNPRIHQWGTGRSDRINSTVPSTTHDYRRFINASKAPVLSHEAGQWCSFPDLKSASKYTGSLKPSGYEIVSALLAKKGLKDCAEKFLMNSGRLQVLTYKEEIESLLRTPNISGFQLLDLRDFPGQGLSPVGMLDPFWQPKPYLRAGEIARFCGPTTPLARFEKRCWRTDEIFAAEIELSHFGAESFSQLEWQWDISSETKSLASGKQVLDQVQRGGLLPLGKVAFDLAKTATPVKLKLTVSIPKLNLANDWDFWVFPDDDIAPVDQGTIIANSIGEKEKTFLDSGGRILLLADPGSVDSDASLGFGPVFWNQVWTEAEPPNTLGICCDPTHRAFEFFPTESHTDWQGWDIVRRAKPMNLDRFSNGLRPLIQVIPDWYDPANLGLLFECKVGTGKLMVCSIDLQTQLDKRIASQQLLNSIVRYMNSPTFDPAIELQTAQIEGLFFADRKKQGIELTVATSSSQKGYGSQNLIDGKAETIWHASWKADSTEGPDWVSLDMGRTVQLAGIRCLPREDTQRTRINEYEIEISTDGIRWVSVMIGRMDKYSGWKTLRFPKPHDTRHVRLISRSEQSHSIASLAEIDIVTVDASSD
jgi:hypothetical protein